MLATAARTLTGREPVQLDARHFMTGGSGRIEADDGGRVRLLADGRAVTADAVVVYEIPPHRRRAFEDSQLMLRKCGARSLGTDAEAWRAATEKDATVARFHRDGVPQMPSVALSRPSLQAAAGAFERLGGDVWARPCVGMGGEDVFHVTTHAQLAAAASHYARAGADWLIARDARNFLPDGRRHQYRVVVLHGRVVRAVEHVQADPDAPCNECRGAVSTLLEEHELPDGLAELAISAAASLGLDLAGVDLAAESGGVVFEVNVHPAFGRGALEQVALPYVAAHLDG
ncbi:ATP-grasp domain-containing protein [Streptomyces sp. 1331.2]|uniref:ATP-grasp domain-containing protein n=1 Tax=Streptomyces sp. 1331.2 TaxID=1938835 RepID=UPI000BDAD323|nr:alpha-L-glutamate ligase [Streptomyces sp. 1331.2]SOB78994.1 Glutathione synthase/RimK-type ligase, ATP-grasp superfamily [Streptomyces sp. 1331.2]